MRIPARTPMLALALSVAASAGVAAQTTIGVTGPPGALVTCTGISSPTWCGQSFTMPAVDDVLQSFSFALSTNDVVAFEIYATSGDALTGPALFSQSFGPSAGSPAISTLVFLPPGGLPLTSGAQFAAMVRMDAGEAVTFQFHSPDPYAGGRTLLACTAADTPCAPALALADMEFEATFVASTASVPEPSTWALLGSGLLGLGGVAARRRRRNG